MYGCWVSGTRVRGAGGRLIRESVVMIHEAGANRGVHCWPAGTVRSIPTEEQCLAIAGDLLREPVC